MLAKFMAWAASCSGIDLVGPMLWLQVWLDECLTAYHVYLVFLPLLGWRLKFLISPTAPERVEQVSMLWP